MDPYVAYEFDRHGIEPAYLTKDQFEKECGRYLDTRISQAIYDLGDGYPTAARFSFMVAKRIFWELGEGFPTNQVESALRKEYSKRLQIPKYRFIKRNSILRKMSKI